MKRSSGGSRALLLIAGAGFAAAFAVGVLYGRGHAPAASIATVSATVAGAATGGGSQAVAASGSGRQSTAGGAVRGTIESTSASTIVIQNAQGVSQTIALTPETIVTGTTAASVSDLTPGTPVQVTGQPGSSGSIAAASITLQPTYSPYPTIGTPPAAALATATPAALSAGGSPATP